MLFVQRAHDDRRYPGRWECPGGKVDLGQGILEALRREVLEETGLRIRVKHAFHHSHCHLISKGESAGLPYLVLFSIVTALSDVVELSHEHDDYAWVNFEGALQLNLTREVRNAGLFLRPLLS